MDFLKPLYIPLVESRSESKNGSCHISAVSHVFEFRVNESDWFSKEIQITIPKTARLNSTPHSLALLKTITKALRAL